MSRTARITTSAALALTLVTGATGCRIDKEDCSRDRTEQATTMGFKPPPPPPAAPKVPPQNKPMPQHPPLVPDDDCD